MSRVPDLRVGALIGSYTDSKFRFSNFINHINWKNYKLLIYIFFDKYVIFIKVLELKILLKFQKTLPENSV